MCCKLLTLLTVIARRQPARFALPTDHPVIILIGDCYYGEGTRGWRERTQVKVALVVGGEDDSGAGK